MCQNATATAAALMGAIKPTLVSLLTLEGIATTPDGIAALNAYDAAETAVQNWTPGTTAEVVVEAVNAFNAVFDTLPISPLVKTLASLISGGIVAVIAVITANAPATVPATTEEVSATPEEATALHQAAVISDATTKIATLVPNFKRSIFTAPHKQYTNAWNGQVDAVNAKIAALKQ